MMKKTLFVFAVAAGAFSCCQQPGYKITGTIPGAPDSIKVWLQNCDSWPQVFTDSTYIIDEKFSFKGKVGATEYCNILFDLSPEEPDFNKKEIKTVDYLFLDNSDVQIECIFDSLPSRYYESPSKAHNVKITGSPSETLYQAYGQSIKELSKEASALYSDYLREYHVPAIKGIFNTEKGVEIVRKRTEVSQKIFDRSVEFIKGNNKSTVAAHVAKMSLARSLVPMTAAQMDDVFHAIDTSLSRTPAYKELQEYVATQKKFAKGEKYLDVPFKNMKGDSVMLSQLIKPGDYTMLEFWASWCGPCRAEIPHLVHVKKACGDRLNMISISLDDNEENWKKAIEEEGVKWTQLVGEQTAREKYGITGVPFCLILDKDGRIIASGVRGAELDNVLLNIWGDKITL